MPVHRENACRSVTVPSQPDLQALKVVDQEVSQRFQVLPRLLDRRHWRVVPQPVPHVGYGSPGTVREVRVVDVLRPEVLVLLEDGYLSFGPVRRTWHASALCEVRCQDQLHGVVHVGFQQGSPFLG